jgi:hypothetical protein
MLTLFRSSLGTKLPARWSRWVLVALGVLAAAGLAVLAAQAIRANPRLPPEQIEATLVEAVKLIEENGLEAHGIDWASALRDARQTANQGQRVADLDRALSSDLLGLLRQRDGHSYYVPAKSAAGLSAAPESDRPVDPFLELGKPVQAFPVLRMSGYAGLNEARNQQAGAAGAQTLAKVLQAKPCGLVLDLRRNDGGNMYPMFQAIAALLPPEPIGYFEDRNGLREPWPLPPRKGPSAAVAVAVLINAGTASSGEFVAIGLRSLPRVRSFGAPSAGLATGVMPFPLPNGGLAGITVVHALDFKQARVTGRLAPDEESTDPLSDAAKWLSAQCPATS